jgi:acyl carrier protein
LPAKPFAAREKSSVPLSRYPYNFSRNIVTSKNENDTRTRVMRKAAELAGMDVEQLDSATSLESLGLDSSDAVILALEIEEATDQEIDVGIFLRFETLLEAADEIARLLADPPPKPSAHP